MKKWKIQTQSNIKINKLINIRHLDLPPSYGNNTPSPIFEKKITFKHLLSSSTKLEDRFQLTNPPSITYTNYNFLNANLSNNDIMQKRKTQKCNCKKSACQKLYCECYAAKEFCLNCHCEGCLNNYESVQLTKLKKEKRETQQISCNCTKSNCKKKYCECFKAGVKCGDKCRCVDCMNVIPKKKNVFHKMKVKRYEKKQSGYFTEYVTERISISIVNGKIGLSHKKNYKG